MVIIIHVSDRLTVAGSVASALPWNVAWLSHHYPCLKSQGKKESNAHRNLVISSSPSPRRDATAQKRGGWLWPTATDAVNRVLRSPP